MKKCYECGDFVSCFEDSGILMSRGVCTLVSDYPSFVGREEYCAWGISEGKRLSAEQILERDKKGSEKHLKFMASLERADKIVESWPEWKKNILS